MGDVVKRFSYFELLFSGAEPFFAILVEGHSKNIPVKLFQTINRLRRRCLLSKLLTNA